MIVDFEFVLTAAAFVSGAIWLWDTKKGSPKREAVAADLLARAGAGVDQNELARVRREPVLVEYARSFFPVLIIVLVLRSFLVEPFRIPSGSMMPTLLAGDFILVNKFNYGVRLPVLKSKIIEVDAPKRGDVVVFRYPKDPAVDYIKRIIGVPGDRIRYFDKTLTINGKVMAQEDNGTYVGVGSGVNMSGTLVKHEHLDTLTHKILIDPNSPTQEGEIVVPPGQYFVMGDNRDNSNDSRYWGMVPEANLVGKAFMIWMNFDWQAGGVTWGRLGTIIK